MSSESIEAASKYLLTNPQLSIDAHKRICEKIQEKDWQFLRAQRQKLLNGAKTEANFVIALYGTIYSSYAVSHLSMEQADEALIIFADYYDMFKPVVEYIMEHEHPKTLYDRHGPIMQQYGKLLQEMQVVFNTENRPQEAVPYYEEQQALDRWERGENANIAPTELIKSCATCRTVAKEPGVLKRCMGCHKVYYCGVECQKKHVR